tara:strand:+ start:294 stop:536 length:243 start_codon:yes stop_codon:yes gene_type:complete
MVQIEYDGVLKRYEVKLKASLADEVFMKVVAYISEDNKLTMKNELPVHLVRTILLHWDEYEFQITKQMEDLLDDKQKGDK